jgi:hypothetical protein
VLNWDNMILFFSSFWPSKLYVRKAINQNFINLYLSIYRNGSCIIKWFKSYIWVWEIFKEVYMTFSVINMQLIYIVIVMYAACQLYSYYYRLSRCVRFEIENQIVTSFFFFLNDIKNNLTKNNWLTNYTIK